ncbi:Zinc finger, RING/FYVE/PHD-type [Corchorus olitorius]|uniref:RING-type E3 ubiquitin transferase n=2 Tax=Corchorus TaxID=93758 RepID=A0A1R3JW82_9ROSI|nr:Zinc finger, RING/FYVE/PHD-type [Corchorus olitorius]
MEIDINYNSTTNNNTNFNATSSSYSSSPSSSGSPNQTHESNHSFTPNAAAHPYQHHPPRPASSSLTPLPYLPLAPPPYVDHKSAKKIKNDVNIHKDSLRLFHDDNNSDFQLISFTFDALVDGSITILYFAMEGPNCTFKPLYPEIYMPRTIPFQKGLAQKFCQPSGTGIDLNFFELGFLSRHSKKEDIFPLVICAEAGLPSFSASAVLDQIQPPPAIMSSHAQITQAVLKKNNEEHFQVQVIKQILWIEGIRYELREIYGIENCNEEGLNDSDQSGKECVICMTEPKDTAALPCRHMCMCSGCAKELRLRSKKCPVCRQWIRELIEIKIQNQPEVNSSEEYQ